LFSKINGQGGPLPDVVVILSSQAYDLILQNCMIIGVQPKTNAAPIISYLQTLSAAGKKIVIRIFPSPGNFTSFHLLLGLRWMPIFRSFMKMSKSATKTTKILMQHA
jgi:hypothetical protein